MMDWQGKAGGLTDMSFSCTLMIPPMFMSAPAAYIAALQSPGLFRSCAGELPSLPLPLLAAGLTRATDSRISASSCGTPRQSAMAS